MRDDRAAFVRKTANNTASCTPPALNLLFFFFLFNCTSNFALKRTFEYYRKGYNTNLNIYARCSLALCILLFNSVALIIAFVLKFVYAVVTVDFFFSSFCNVSCARKLLLLPAGCTTRAHASHHHRRRRRHGCC